MLVAELLVDTQLWAETLRNVPELTLTTEELYRLDDGTVRAYNWASCEDYAAFEAAVTDDPTVTNLELVTDIGPRRLYRADFTDRGMAVATFPEWGDLDVVLVDARARADGWTITMRFPDADALTRFQELTREVGDGLELRHLYREDGRTTVAGSALTPAQRDALVVAFDAGYFEVPRDASQTAVAEALGISEQALSERLRRGTAALINATLRDGGDVKS